LLPGGFTGVDVFFVISGYVVSASMAKDGTQSLTVFLRAFYIRRLIRIYPALLACLLGTFILCVLFVPASWLSGTSWKVGLAAFFGAGNLALPWFSDGYFSPRIEFNAFVHTWSLGVEEQFYLLYPLLFFAWLRTGQTLGAAVVVVLVPALASLAYSAWASQVQPEYAFYLLPSRFWELAAGGFLFQLHASGHALPITRAGRQVALWLGLTCIATAFAFATADHFPVPWALMPVLGAMLCIAAAVAFASASEGGGSGQAGVLASPGLTAIGKLSYSLYLWHWPVFVLFRWTVGMQGYNAALAALVAFLAASASYRYVELPLRGSLPRIAARRPSFLLQGLAFIVVASVLALGIWTSRSWTSLSLVNRESDLWYPIPTGRNLAATQPPTAEFAGRRLFVVGDSHVPAYAVMLKRLEVETRVAVQVFWKGGCAAAPLSGASTPDCADFLRQSMETVLRQAAAGDVVFLPGLRTPRLSDQWTSFDDAELSMRLNSEQARADRARALVEANVLVDTLERAGLTVLFEAPKPTFAAPPFRCADWFNAGNPICRPGTRIERDRLASLSTPVRESIEALRRAHPAMRVWDPFPVLCPGSSCSAFDASGKPLFADGDHLSAYGNWVLQPHFTAALRSAWRRPA
jgi:peptidoglycan/LPS O-acetylase OafA/YrhL